MEQTVCKLDKEIIFEAAEKAGVDVKVWIKGKSSMGLIFINNYGGKTVDEDYVEVNCSGNTYWIEVGRNGSTEHPEKWCMPRAEVSGDRADKFLVDVLRNIGEQSDLRAAVAIVLGIDSIASRGYTKDILKNIRESSNS